MKGGERHTTLKLIKKKTAGVAILIKKKQTSEHEKSSEIKGAL